MSTVAEYDTWHGRLCSAFTIRRLPIVAARLGIAPDRYALAEAFFEEAVYALTGYRIDTRKTRAEQRQTSVWEAAGAEAYARGELTVAEAYFSEAWTNLCGCPPADSNEELLLRLSVGRQLLSVNALLGTTDSAPLVLREVERLALKAIRTPMTQGEVLSVAGAALTQVAVAHRLRGNMKGREVAGFSRLAHQALAARGLDLPAQLCGLRDQAKPLLADAFKATDQGQAAPLIQRAEVALAKADELAGGQHPREELYEPWLQTRLTKIECLALVGTPDTAQREWELLRGQSWLDGFLKQKTRAPLRAKIRATEMAVAAGRGDLDELGQLAASFQSAPENAAYGHRQQQVSSFERYAVTGDPAHLRRALLG